MELIKDWSFEAELITKFKAIATEYIKAGSAKANGRDPKSCLGRVYNFKASCFVYCIAHMHPLLELKTCPRFCPVN